MRHRLAAALALLAAAPVIAQQNLPIVPALAAPAGVTYDPSVPTPEAVLGVPLGMRHARPDELVEYARRLDAASDRIAVVEYGRTYEGRPLIHAIVTSPSNHARLEAIRQQHLRLSDDPGDVSDADLARMPVVAYFGYSVHGNEASGADASMGALYHLAAGRGPEMDRLLENTVILLDPSMNPDGRGRFVSWIDRYAGANPTADGQDLEHNEAWPGGRGNHYWFDLNRDWLPLVHPESAARVAQFHRWRPTVLLDWHEMGGEATYFFQPGVASRVNPSTPSDNQTLTARIAQFHGRALDRIGSLYYTGEGFDDFYYGKGSTFPDAQGSIGILFEQASSRARVVDTGNNGRLTYGFTVRNQLVTSLSTMEALVAMREDLLRHTRDVYRGASGFARSQGVGAYVFAGEASRAGMLVDLLRAHRIRVHRLGQTVTAEGQTFRAGEAFVVPADQPQARLIRGMMERPTTFTDSLFYDVSAWTYPLAYGLRFAETNGARLGAEVTNSAAPQGRVIGRATVAYAIPWGRFYAARALFRLQDKGVRVRLTASPFDAQTAEGRRTFGRGTLVVTLGHQDAPADSLHRWIEYAAQQDGLDVYGLSSGLALSGADIGSIGSNVLAKPVVALVVGEGTNSLPAGEMWHLLGERTRVPVSLLEARRLNAVDLYRYNTLVMTGGSYPGVRAEDVRTWVQRGGRLVATGQGAEWAARNGVVTGLDAKTAPSTDSTIRALPFAQQRDARGAESIAGALFEARVDTTHPVGYGLPDRLVFFRDADAFFRPPTAPGQAVATYTASPRIAGYLPRRYARSAGGSAAVVAQRIGQGRAVLIFDDPTFRGFWLGTSQLALNAVFFGGSF
ncbi:MAG: peptidase M14 [Rhodothermales bacterium]|nr:peptidase M14 [Rhodothermales bacterium]